MARVIAVVLAGITLAAGTVLGPAAEPARAGALVLKSCSAFGDPGTATDAAGPVWQPQAPSSYSLANRCAQGGSFQISPARKMSVGANAQWHTVTPPTIGITGAATPINDVLVLPNSDFDGFHATYFWNGGAQTVTGAGLCCGRLDYGVGINRNDLNGSHYFGFQITCIASGGCNGLVTGGEVLDVKGIELTAQDNTAPSVVALGSGNLWYQASRWVRGVWPMSFQATDDSGICAMRAIVDGQSIPGPGVAPNQSSWTQCPTPQTMNQTIDTASYPNGPLSLLLSAADAASPANVSSPTETVNLDNAPVTLGLSGPADALSTAGAQYVTATASAGPSGVADIQCSVDGAPFVSYPGSSTQVPVQGVGAHGVTCVAHNRAIDGQSGQPASSPSETWHLSIRQPTAAAISFGLRLVNALRCHRVRVRVKVPAHWVTLRRHGRRVHEHRGARTVIRHEQRCHPRVVIRKVKVRGRVVRKRIVLTPRQIAVSTKRVRYRRGVTVSGWLALSDDAPLANTPVQIVTAVDNGRGRYGLAASVTTNSQGIWQAQVGGGPSRLIAAVYPGSTSTEPARSIPIHLISSAEVQLSIRPLSARWGHTVGISGRVLGGNFPAGKLLRLRIGVQGLRSTAGIPDVDRHGRFHTAWTFAPGRGTVRYWFSVSTLPEADYPYAQTSSRRVYVTVHN